MKRSLPTSWTIDDATELYGVERWGEGYFGISPNGHVEINAQFDGQIATVSLMDIIAGMSERGLEMPSMLRIENILDDRIRVLNETFQQTIDKYQYNNVFRGVFPIKVNQQSHVIEEIAEFGHRYNHGLEAGSKAELLIALAHLKGDDSFIICNGYKDSEFIDLGLYAIRLGIRCIFVVETPAELATIISRSQALSIKPLLGVRLKLMAKVDGHWSEDSGDRSIFGLSAIQLIDVIDQLKAADMLNCLQLMHFHLGSQIPNIRNIRSGVQESCRHYAELIAEGAPLKYIDLGGGLAVDYDGTRSNEQHSKNYDIEEYCADIIETIMEVLDPLDIEHPVIITESGRATVAYSSILLFNILNVANFDARPLPETLPEDIHDTIKNMLVVAGSISVSKLQENFNDAEYYRDEIRELFRRGEIGLRDRSIAENMYLAIVQQIAALLPELDRVPAELEGLQDLLADIYYGNFSVFQSLPDAWAIDQVFPVMPVHRLQEAPSREAVIADITCDCDGKLDHFSDGEATLPLHKFNEGEDYYIGVFLVGAYQETLGDLHNLFGDNNIVSVRINVDGSFDFIQEIHGDSIADVLSYVEYNPKELLERFRRSAELAVKQNKISAIERKHMVEEYSASLRGYTYYEK